MSDSPFALETQNGIFNLFFQLYMDYAKVMNNDAAFLKAIGWMESLTEDLKKKHKEITDQKIQAEQTMRAES